MDKAIGYLSLAAKAGKVVIGAEDCEKAVRRGNAVLIVLAADAAPSAIKRAKDLAGLRNTEIFWTVYTKAELAQAVGRGSSVALAVLADQGLASAFKAVGVTATEQEELL